MMRNYKVIPKVCMISIFFNLITISLYAGTYKEIVNFGENPSNIKMFLYTPDVVAEKPPVLVACHWCHGKAQDIYNGSRYASVADKFGYYVIFPSAISSDGCWDVASELALKHNGGGDPFGIVSMVRYVIKNYNADSTRVYALGVSSGAMMTNVLLGAYPDVFAAGAAFAGVPFGCFAGPNSWNDDCAKGRITKSGKEWGDLMRAAYPGYTGKRPRIQIWHGTNDEVLDFHNFGEAIKQWADVHGIDTIPSSKESDVFQTGWTRQKYKNQNGEVLIEAVIEQNQPHNLQVLQDEALAFLGLDQPSTGAHYGTMLYQHTKSYTTSFTALKTKTSATVTIRSVPGSATLTLYTLNGQIIQSLRGTFSSAGMHTFHISKNISEHTKKSSSIYIMEITVDGSVAGTYTFKF